jgi:holo-[acyl-carrier protein] synthase
MSRPSLGVDIEEISRFKSLIKNKKFLHRVFTSEEIRYCNSKKNKLQHFAVRFSAKEAVWKALSNILNKKNMSIAHRDIGIRNNKIGKPEVMLPAKLKAISARMAITLSHTKSYAVAVALIN